MSESDNGPWRAVATVVKDLHARIANVDARVGRLASRLDARAARKDDPPKTDQPQQQQMPVGISKPFAVSATAAATVRHLQIGNLIFTVLTLEEPEPTAEPE